MRDDYFEWDDEKSDVNKVKHGIDFEEARALWTSGVAEFPSPRGIEMRYVAFGRLRGRLCLVAFTYRGHRRRLISAREATDDEQEKYEAEKKRREKRSS